MITQLIAFLLSVFVTLIVESHTAHLFKKDYSYEKRNCSLFAPKIVNIEHTDEAAYNVTWSTEIVVTIIEFSIGHRQCPLLVWSDFWAQINCTTNSSHDVLYAMFKDANNCTSYTTAQFFEELNDDDSKDVQIAVPFRGSSEATVVPAVPIQDLQVEAFFNDFYNVIQLNISWSKPSDLPEYYDFGISHADNTSSYCNPHYNYETFHNNKLLTNISLPKQPASSTDKIKPGCTYKVWVKSQYFDGIVPSITYTVSDCVGPICNYCTASHLIPKAEILEINQIGDDILNVSWSSYDRFVHNSTYDITSVRFRFRKNDSYDTHDCVALTEIPEVSDENVSTVIRCDGLVPLRTYVLIARFENNFNCSKSYSRNFTVDFFDVSSKESTIWQSVSAQTTVFFAAILAVSLVFYFRGHPITENLKFLFIRTDDAVRNVDMNVLSTVNSGRADESYNILYCETEIVNGEVDLYEFPRSRLKITKLLDSGAFGQVFSAEIIGPINGKTFPTVAVKTLRDQAPPEEVEDFLSEINILKKIGQHPNIVTLVGCCTLKQPHLMIMQLVPCGSLKSYLLKLRRKWESTRTSQDSVFLDSSDGVYISPDSPRSPTSSEASHRFPSVTETEYTNVESGQSTPLIDKFRHQVEPVLDHVELHNFALQIAKGMSYLEEKGITHRDLAARNVLVDEFRTLKISDFGLSRMCPYINHRTKKLPLRWMAIESIEEHFYSSKSDVWSFGVVLWEIGSLGALPYERTPDSLILHDLVIGKRLDRPEICTDELYKLMRQCWAAEANVRPTFQEIVQLFSSGERRIYVDFGQLNPTYVFPPSKLERM